MMMIWKPIWMKLFLMFSGLNNIFNNKPRYIIKSLSETKYEKVCQQKKLSKACLVSTLQKLLPPSSCKLMQFNTTLHNLTLRACFKQNNFVSLKTQNLITTSPQCSKETRALNHENEYASDLRTASRYFSDRLLFTRFIAPKMCFKSIFSILMLISEETAQTILLD